MAQAFQQTSVTLETALALTRQRRWPEAMQVLAQLAQQGNVRAMEIAGKISMVHQDVSGAMRWFRRALTAGETADRLCDLANALLASGAREEARKFYLRAIALDPHAAAPHCHYGRMLLAEGKVAESVPELQQAVAADAGYLQALLALGEALLKRSDARGGKAALERVLALDSKNDAALGMLAAAEEALGNIEGAQAYCQQALQRNPKNIKALATLGSIAFRQGDMVAALQNYQRCLSLMPGSAAAHNNCGLALLRLGQEDAAIAHFRKALNSKEDFAGAAINLGSVLHLSGHVEEALELFQKACKMAPEDPQAFAGLADVQQSLGNGEAAYQAFLHTIELAPDVPETYRRLVSMGPDWPLPPEWLAHLRELALHEAEMSDLNRSELHFALYRIAEDAGQDAEAARHLLAANAARRKITHYDEAAEMQLMAELKKRTPSGVFREKAGMGCPSEVPVFIVGMPRSGTSLLEQILASHPDVYGVGEIPDFGEVLGCHGRLLPDLDLTHASAGDLQTLGNRYLTRIQKISPQASRIINKLPWNFQLVGYIHLLLPKAHIIHLYRDPMDTCLSCFAQDFRGTLDFCYDQGELGRYYRAYQDMMVHWREVLPEGSLCEVSYETLVENFEPEVRRILEFCGLKWDPACQKFYEAKRAVRTASVMQVRHPIYHGSVGRWKRYRTVLAPLQQALSG